MDGRTLADRVAQGDARAVARVAGSFVRVRPDNLVERPWGGRRLAAYKGLTLDTGRAAKRFGEAFEIAADPSDPECAAHPSIAVLEDGSEIALPALLDRAGEAILGEVFVRKHGKRLPVLPKTLDIAELLSVQVHPPEMPELYIVIDADPGASIRLGFERDVDAKELRARLEALGPVLHARAAEPQAAMPDALRAANEYVLDLLNEIPVRAGDVIWNASGATRDPRTPSSDIHALGNPEGREILMLEVRTPGPTWRLWDHGRLPARALHIAQAFGLLALRTSAPDAFRIAPTPLAGHAGAFRAVECGAFAVDVLRPTPGQPAVPPGIGAPRTLHVIRGEVTLHGEGGKSLGVLRRGESVLVPAAFAPAEVGANTRDAQAVQITLPAR